MQSSNLWQYFETTIILAEILRCGDEEHNLFGIFIRNTWNGCELHRFSNKFYTKIYYLYVY